VFPGTITLLAPPPHPFHLLPADGAEGGEGKRNGFVVVTPKTPLAIFKVIPMSKQQFEFFNCFFPRHAHYWSSFTVSLKSPSGASARPGIARPGGAVGCF